MQDFINSHGVSLTTKEAFPSGMRHMPLRKKNYYSHLKYKSFSRQYKLCERVFACVGERMVINVWRDVRVGACVGVFVCVCVNVCLCLFV